MSTCAHCGSQSWHSSTVCSDCGLPYGNLPIAAIAELDRLRTRLQEAEMLLSEVKLYQFSGYENWLTRRDAWLQNKEERNVKS